MRSLLCFAAFIMTASVLYAEKPRYRAVMEWSQPVKVVESEKPEVYGTTAGSDDALDEVNAFRAKQGLPPFQRDESLTQAAQKAATIRAKSLINGHLNSDFDCLPAGAHADSAGCGALDDSWGWGTCCATDNYRYAGAAWKRGADGKRYMHLFVSNRANTANTANTEQKQPPAKAEPVATVTPANSESCSSGSCGVSQRSRRRR